MQEIQGLEDLLEKETATHSSIVVWEIQWTEEPGGLQSVGLQKNQKQQLQQNMSDLYGSPTSWYPSLTKLIITVSSFLIWFLFCELLSSWTYSRQRVIRRERCHFVYGYCIVNTGFRQIPPIQEEILTGWSDWKNLRKLEVIKSVLLEKAAVSWPLIMLLDSVITSVINELMIFFKWLHFVSSNFLINNRKWSC